MERKRNNISDEDTSTSVYPWLLALVVGPFLGVLLQKLAYGPKLETISARKPSPYPCNAIYSKRRDLVSVPKTFASTLTPNVVATRLERIDERDRLAHFFREHQSHHLDSLGDSKGRIFRYVCDDTTSCGGLGDRVRGVYTTMFHAVLTGGAFHITDIKPFDDTIFFDRSRIDDIRTSYALKCRPMARVAPWLNMDVPAEQTAHVNFGQEWSKYDVIEVRSNQLPHASIYANAIFGRRLAELGLATVPFEVSMSAVLDLAYGTPTEWMHQKIKAVNSQIDAICGVPSHRVGVQLRTAGQKTRFSDGPDYQAEGFGTFSTRVTNFARQAQNSCFKSASRHCCIFLTSDDEEAFSVFSKAVGEGEHVKIGAHVDAFRSATRNISIIHHGGSTVPIHLDRSTGAGPEFFVETTKTYIDWYVLAYCMDHLVISYSGYGESAALANLTDFVVETRTGFDRQPVRYLGLPH